MTEESSDSFYVTLHSSSYGSIHTDNTGCDFTCDLPQEIQLSPFENYKVALVKLICDKPIIRSKRIFNGRDYCYVLLEELDPIHCDAFKSISGHRITAEIARYKRSYGTDYMKASDVHVYEPKHLRFYSLTSQRLISFTIRLRDRHLRPLYRDKQATTVTTVVLQIKRMANYANIEHVPLSFSSIKTSAFETNTPTNFRVEIPSRFTNNTGKPWYVAVTSVTYSPEFTLLPSYLRNLQPFIIRRNLGEIRNDLDYIQIKPMEDDYYDIHETTGDIYYKIHVDQLGPFNDKFQLLRALKEQLKFSYPARLRRPDISILVNYDQDLKENTVYDEDAANITFKFHAGPSYEGSDLVMCYCFAVLLDIVKFDPSKTANELVRVPVNVEYKKPQSFDTWYHPRKLFLYANFVEPSINGSIFSPLLAIIPVQKDKRTVVDGTSSHYTTYEATQLTYHKLSLNNFTQCHVEVRDEFGEYIRFQYPEETTFFIDLVVQVNK